MNEKKIKELLSTDEGAAFVIRMLQQGVHKEINCTREEGNVIMQLEELIA